MPTTLPQDLLRDGDYLVVRQRWVTLPAGCVVCGAAESRRMPLKIRKATRWLARLGMFGAMIYFISPVARMHAGFCDEHRPSAMMRYLFGVLLMGAFVSFALASYLGIPEAMLMSGVITISLVNFAVMFEMLRSKSLKAVHADRHFVWLAKVSPTILDQVPEIDSTAEPAR